MTFNLRAVLKIEIRTPLICKISRRAFKDEVSFAKDLGDLDWNALHKRLATIWCYVLVV